MNKKKRKNAAKRRRQSAVIFMLFGLLMFFAVRGLIGLITGEGIPQESSSQTVQSSETASSQPEESSQLTEADTKPEKNEYTILVNLANPLTEDYQVETREIICNGQPTGKQFDVRVIDKLEKMLDDAAAAGYCRWHRCFLPTRSAS